MELQFFLGLDRAVFEWIERVFFDRGISAIITPVMAFITHLGDGGALWVALALGLIVFKKTRRCGITLAVALLCMMLINDLLLKPLIARPRPFNLELWKDWFVFPEIISRPSSFSFPSGHTSSSFAAATALTSLKKKSVYIPAFILAALIAFSRIYLHVHYCTDVLFGMAAGIAYGIIAICLVYFISKLIKKCKKESEINRG
jgi:undecaprenyl-diphosphatase